MREAWHTYWIPRYVCNCIYIYTTYIYIYTYNIKIDSPQSSEIDIPRVWDPKMNRCDTQTKIFWAIFVLRARDWSLCDYVVNVHLSCNLIACDAPPRFRPGCKDWRQPCLGMAALCNNAEEESEKRTSSVQKCEFKSSIDLLAELISIILSYLTFLFMVRMV